ncbi:hypothetical protein WG66_015806 [Moniliophthora roreri]|nr:hypothetical protein WG66_015806 [Moniliophthora roreri]
MAGTKKWQRKGKGATGVSQDADIQPASCQNVHSGTHQAVLQDNDDDGNEDNPFSFKPTGLDNTSALAQPTPVLCQPGSCSHSQGHANVHFANKSPGKEFEWDNTSNDSADESNVLATPTPCAHTRNNNDKTPQAFRHAPLSQPQPNIQRLPACSSRLYSYTAENCWNWQETEMEYICNICLELKSKSEFPETFKVQTYKLSSGITNMHNHLMLPTHLPIWIAHCDHLGIPIKALLIIKKVEAYQNEHGVEVPAVLATQVFSKFSIEGLTQLLMEVIITKNLPITFVESEQTTMMKVIIKTWHQKMYELAAEMKLTLSKISFTCDGWTDLNLFPFIAITAHWIKEVVILEKTKCGIQMQTLLEFHSDVIAFHEVLVSHTGAHLKEAFLYLVNWLGLLKKIGWITCNNATNNDTMFERLEYQLEGIGIDFYYLHNHIRCFAHIIHLAVTVILHFMNEEDLAAIFAQRDGGTLPSTHKPGVLTRTRGMVQEVPHAFQHFLSTDRTPCLAYAILAFHSIIDNMVSTSLKITLTESKMFPHTFCQCLDWIEQNMCHHKTDILDTFHDELQQRCSHGNADQHPSTPQEQPKANAMDDKWAWNILQLDTTLVSDKKDGLVKYWEANHEKYPTIFALAVDLLLIQGTSVPCNELMAATQILKNSIKHNSPLNFTRHYNQSNEMTELEEIIHQDEDHIPDTVDVETFRRNLPTVSFVQ